MPLSPQFYARYMSPTAPPNVPDLGTLEQLARGFVSGSTFNMIEPYKDAGKGGVPELLANIAGAAIPGAGMIRGAGLVPAAMRMLAPAITRSQAIKAMVSPGWRALGRNLSPGGQALGTGLGVGTAAMAPWAVDTAQGEPTEAFGDRATTAALGAGLAGGLSGVIARKLGRTPLQAAQAGAQQGTNHFARGAAAQPATPPPPPRYGPGGAEPPPPPGQPWRAPGQGGGPTEASGWTDWLTQQKPGPSWEDWLGGQEADTLVNQMGGPAAAATAKSPNKVVWPKPPTKAQDAMADSGRYLPIGAPGGPAWNRPSGALGADLAATPPPPAAPDLRGMTPAQIYATLKQAGIVTNKTPEEQAQMAEAILGRKQLGAGAAMPVQGSPLAGTNILSGTMTPPLPPGQVWARGGGERTPVAFTKKPGEVVTPPGISQVGPEKAQILNPQTDVVEYKRALAKAKNLYKTETRWHKTVEPAQVDPQLYKAGVNMIRQGDRQRVPPRVRVINNIGDDAMFGDPDLWWLFYGGK